MIRGDVYNYKFKEPNKTRPVLILTRTELIARLHTVTVAEITTTIRGNDSEVLLNESDGMREECAVNLINIQTVLKEKIRSYVTHLSEEKMQEVFEAIQFAFGFGK
jgi:mRNA interferase MazF